MFRARLSVLQRAELPVSRGLSTPLSYADGGEKHLQERWSCVHELRLRQSRTHNNRSCRCSRSINVA